MSKTKVKVPDGMLKAAINAIQPSVLIGTMNVALEAALLWQDGLLEKMVQGDPYEKDQYMRSESLNENAVRTGFNKAIANIRRMYDAHEPEVPEEIADLISKYEDVNSGGDALLIAMARGHNADILEAFRRGKESK